MYREQELFVLFWREADMTRLACASLVVITLLVAPTALAQYSYGTTPVYPSYTSVVQPTICIQPYSPITYSTVCVIPQPAMVWHPGCWTKEGRTQEINVVYTGYWVEEPGIMCFHGNQGPPVRIWHPERHVRELRTCWIDVWHEGYWSY